MSLDVNSILWLIIGAAIMWVIDWFLYGRGSSGDSHDSHDDHGHAEDHSAEISTLQAEIDGYKSEIASLNAQLDAGSADADCEDKLAAAEAKIAELESRLTVGDEGTPEDLGLDASVLATPMAETEEDAEPETFDPDDLKKIEGIGPKISRVLNEAGIFTFAQLAATPVATLEKIVREDAGITIAFPDTWPQQAGLASSGKWEDLARLQDSLKGGRKK